MTSLPSCPPYGQNSLGIASLRDGKTKLVRIEFMAPGHMLHCRSVDEQQPVCIPEQNFSLMPLIPSKYREYHFQSLAVYWAEALKDVGKGVVITPKNLSQDTLVRKLRESKTAKDKYGWRHPLVDEVLWQQFSPSLVITPLNDGTVRIGKEGTKALVAFEGAITSNNQILINWKDKATLEHFCKLASLRVFDPKPSFVVFGLDEQLITDLENRYDVGFNLREDGKSHEVLF